MDHKFTSNDLRNAIRILISEIYPFHNRFSEEHYSLDDLTDQIVFEIIKEEYKEYVPKHTIQHYIDLYDVDADHRKYTPAIQYGQHYRDANNQYLETALGIHLDKLDAQDMSG